MSLRTSVVVAGVALAAGVAQAETPLGEAMTPLSVGKLVMADDKPPPPPESYPSWLDGWKGNVEAGINGSEGNSETANFRFGIGAKRTLKAYETTFSTSYVRNSTGGEASAHKFDVRLRNDWNLGDTPWIVWAQGALEYDQFQSWKWRVTGSGGVGYKFINNDTTTLIGRVGLGFRKDLGGPDKDWTFEGVIGVDYSHKFNERLRFTFTGEYYPSLSDFPEYRLLGRAGLEYLLSAESKMFLRLGAEDNYLSKPGAGRKKNDLTYFATLGWAF